MPTFQVTDPNSGRKVRLTGDSPPTEQELEQIFAELPVAQPEITPEQPQVAPIQPERTFAGDIAGLVQPTLEPVATMVTGAVAEPAAGIAGLAVAPFAGAEEAAETVRSVQEALTFIPRTPEGMAKLQRIAEFLQPVGEAVQAGEEAVGGAAFEATGAPLAGALGEAAPTAALELAGLGIARRALKTAARVKAEIPDATDDVAQVIADSKPKTDVGAQIGDIKSGVEPEAKNYAEIISDLRNKKIKQAAEQVLPDQDILKAAEDLNVDLNPSHYSTNRAFIDVEQSLKSRPGSKLAAREEKAIQDLGQRADDLIADIGGETDKSLLDANVRTDINSTIADLEKQADIAYKAVSDTIPASTVIVPSAVRTYLNRTIESLGGDKSLLSSSEKKLLALVGENRTPTYAAIDRIRKDVGQGFRKRSGPFKDDSEGTLKQIYKVLSEDQQGVSDAFGVGADYSAARRLVASRKQIEDSAISLMGRELQGSIVPKITQAATALTKGDISRFNKLMDSLPKNRRSEAAATMLNDIFTLGARQKGAIGQGFMNAFQGLNRNAKAKDVLFSKLPKDSRRRFDNIGKVATGIFRSKALENTSKTARDLIAAMDDGGMFGKVYDVGRKAALAEGVSTTIGLPGAGTAGVIGSALAKRRTKSTEAADELITSKAFKDAVEKSARSGDPKVADDILKRSPAFRKWIKFASPREAAQITTVGFIPWVTGQIQPPTEEE